MRILKKILRVIICAGKDKISFIFFAPKYFAIVADIAVLVWANIQIKAEINDPAIPTAAKDSVALISMFPIIAVSVIDKSGSAIPAIRAGIANLFIRFKLISVFKKVFLAKLHI